jgi:hypothetical protein
MRQQVQIFSQEHSMHQAGARKCMDTLLNYVDLFEEWANILPAPQGVDIWAWIDWKMFSHHAKLWLVGIRGYFEILLMLNGQYNETSQFSTSIAVYRKP